MELLYILLVLLVATRVFGEAAERIGQPPLVGEIIAGILIGLVARASEAAFPVLSGLGDNEVFVAITELGMFFLMLLAGLEMRPRSLARASGSALAVAFGGLLLPLALGVALAGLYFPPSSARVAQILFLGVALAITAVPVSVRVLIDLGALESRVGRVIVSAALFDDVLGLVLLAILAAVLETGAAPGLEGLVALFAKVGLFFAVSVVGGLWLYPRLGCTLRRLRVEEIEFSGLLIVALGYALLAELLDMHFIIGAFVAGLFFVRGTIDEETYDDVMVKVNGLTKGFLAPLFFASIGLHLELGAVAQVPGFMFALVAVAVVGKVAGAGAAARAIGLTGREALAVGAGMNARGAVELVVADVALRAGLFAHPKPPPPVIASLYSAVILMAVVTTLMTPVVLTRLLRSRE